MFRLLKLLHLVEWTAAAHKHVMTAIDYPLSGLLWLFGTNEPSLNRDGLFVGGHDGGLVNRDRFLPLPVALLKSMWLVLVVIKLRFRVLIDHRL